MFTTDPRIHLDGVLDDGQIAIARDGFFPTPPDVARRMFAKLQKPLVPRSSGAMYPTRILEPEAGLGQSVTSF